MMTVPYLYANRAAAGLQCTPVQCVSFDKFDWQQGTADTLQGMASIPQEMADIPFCI